MSIEDVTAQVNGVVKEGMPAGQAAMARRGIINKLEDDSFKNSGLRSNVITLYQGGVYHLYRFKKYTDVRLVFAPEQQIAFYGGDPDNFEYPVSTSMSPFFAPMRWKTRQGETLPQVVQGRLQRERINLCFRTSRAYDTIGHHGGIGLFPRHRLPLSP